MILVLLAPAGSRAEQLSFEPPRTYRIKDGPAQVVLGVQDGVLAYTAITSSRAPKVRPVFGGEFYIGLKSRELAPADFKVIDVSRSGPGSLDMKLVGQDPRLTVMLHYRQASGSFFIRKWLELKPAAGTSVFLDRIALARFKAWAEPETFKGPGQPVYVGDTFWGVEYPSAENGAKEGVVACSYLVGLTVTDKGYVSRSAVYGVSYPGRVRAAFFEYVNTIRARPIRPFLLWNTWYDLRNYSEREVIAEIAGIKAGLTEPWGIRLDAVVLDDGWDDFHDLWRPHHERFAQGLAPVRDAARETGAELGLWMSPIGGYGTNQARRLLGTLGQGYEKNAAGFCFAGEKYRRTFERRMAGYVRGLGVNYFKLDNLAATCNLPWHGHRVGRYAQVGLTDAFITVLEDARRAGPEVMINFTVGSWPSPWWLRYSDVIWRGGRDYGFAGVGSRRQRSITYVDTILYRRLRQEGAQFPVNSLMTHGIIKGRYESFGERDGNLRDFADDCWIYFGRGVMMQELYLSPGLLSENEWKVLARAIIFARGHAELLARTEMVLGDPAAGEVYGFYHERGNERLLVLRNPGDQAPRAPAAFWPDIRPRACQVIYSSTGEALASPLAPLEVRVIGCGVAKLPASRLN